MTPERWKQINDLLQAALECEPDERKTFLDKVCAGDPDLRRQLEALIAADEQAANFLEDPAFVAHGDSLRPEVATQLLADDQADSIVGQRIGSYQVLGEISHGGMGVVYLATRADDEYRKQVAIKLVKRGMDTDAIVRRFRHERQILANLDHPHIAKLLDGGTTEDGLPYFVMDYVEGFPIDVYCDRQKLSVRERLTLFRAVCSAVHYAHQHQVIHRDLKPSNILVTSDGMPKLLDFGIAKVLNPELYAQTVEPTTTQRLSWYEPGADKTKAYEPYLLVRLINSTIEDVSRQEQVGYEAVVGVVDRTIGREVDGDEYDGLPTVGRDEIALKKGHCDFVVIATVRPPSGRVSVLAVLADRRKETVKQFLHGIPARLKTSIQTVCPDLYDGFINAVKEELPEATVVADRFPMAKKYRECADQLRKREVKRLKQELSEPEYEEVIPFVVSNRTHSLFQKRGHAARQPEVSPSNERTPSTDCHNGSNTSVMAASMASNVSHTSLATRRLT